MVQTFAGEALDPLRAVRRPRSPRRIKRPHRTPTPAAWFVVWMEHLGLGDKHLVWESWQAVSSSMFTEPRQLAQAVALWPHCPEYIAALPTRGLTPQRLMVCLELLVVEGRLSPKEAALLEEALLRHVTAAGTWQ